MRVLAAAPVGPPSQSGLHVSAPDGCSYFDKHKHLVIINILMVASVEGARDDSRSEPGNGLLDSLQVSPPVARLLCIYIIYAIPGVLPHIVTVRLAAVEVKGLR